MWLAVAGSLLPSLSTSLNISLWQVVMTISGLAILPPWFFILGWAPIWYLFLKVSGLPDIIRLQFDPEKEQIYLGCHLSPGHEKVNTSLSHFSLMVNTRCSSFSFNHIFRILLLLSLGHFRIYNFVYWGRRENGSISSCLGRKCPYLFLIRKMILKNILQTEW